MEKGKELQKGKKVHLSEINLEALCNLEWGRGRALDSPLALMEHLRVDFLGSFAFVVTFHSKQGLLKQGGGGGEI